MHFRVKIINKLPPHPFLKRRPATINTHIYINIRVACEKTLNIGFREVFIARIFARAERNLRYEN